MVTRFPFYPVDRRRELEERVAEYVFHQIEPTPWTPLKRPLRESRVSLVTTAGLRLATQHQFAVARNVGSAEHREVSVYVRPSDLAYDFTNYDPTEAQEDINVLVPVDRVRELVDERTLGGVTETLHSFFGLCEDIQRLKESAAAVAGRILSQGADVALIFTANLICNQTGGILAREMERHGISTVLLATVREIVEQVRVPRSVFVNFPFGRPFGRAGDRETQRSVLVEMVEAFKHHQRPGKIRDVSLTWKGEVEY